MSCSPRRTVVAVLAGFTLVAAACGSDDDPSGSDSASDTSTEAASSSQDEPSGSADDAELPTIVVTTNVLGDVVEEIVGGQATIVTIMPVGADPHDFQASAQEVDQMVSAGVLVTNGAGFEEGLEDVIDAARTEGVATYEAISAVDTIEFGERSHAHEEHSDEDHGDEEHSDEEHSDEEHSDEEHSDEEHSDEEHSDEDHGDEEHSDEEHDGHDHEGVDPHFFNDPMRMAAAVDGIVGFLIAEVPALDTEELEASAAAYVSELDALDAEIEAMVDDVPVEQRVLVTNHDVFGYFADRYGFEIVGVVIPGGSTTDAASAGELAELAEVIEVEGVPAIFGDTSSSDELINVLADEVGDVEVVELYSESLGEPGSEGETYLEMQRTNAERISSALA